MQNKIRFYIIIIVKQMKKKVQRIRNEMNKKICSEVNKKKKQFKIESEYE